MPTTSDDGYAIAVEQDLRADVDVDLPASDGHDVDVAIDQETDDSQDIRLDIDSDGRGDDELSDVEQLTRILDDVGIDIDVISQTRPVHVDLRIRIDQDSEADSDISASRDAEDGAEPDAVEARMEQTADVELRTDVMIDIEEDDDGSIQIEIEIEIDNDSEVEQDIDLDDEDEPAGSQSRVDQRGGIDVDRDIDVRIDDIDDVDVDVDVVQRVDFEERGHVEIDDAPDADAVDIRGTVAVDAETDVGIMIDFG